MRPLGRRFSQSHRARRVALLAAVGASLVVGGAATVELRGGDAASAQGTPDAQRPVTSGAAANGSTTSAAALAQDTYPKADYPGLQHLHYRFGPVHIAPGQNLINFMRIAADSKPSVPGYITAFRPNLTYLDGTVPRVDVVHLHHGVWIVDGETRWASGEEKTFDDLPQGFGWRSTPTQSWVMNHMIHNLFPNPTDVYITWDIDFLPDTAPAAAGIKPVTTKWMDVSGPSRYPVFDATRQAGRKTFTFPDQAAPGARGLGSEHRWVVPSDQTLVWTAGHLHPGGLHTDLTITRGAKTVSLFRSNAHYWEPAGPVSWDVALGATKPDWRVKVRKGDVIKVSGTYDVSHAAWYESMAIMFVARYAGTDVGGVDPFVGHLDRAGLITHGHLAENAHHGGGAAVLPDARSLPSRPAQGAVAITGFLSSRGDLNGSAGALPTIRRGGALTFVNKDAARNIFHTITACRAPCNGTAGIAFPLADGPGGFDSGELGVGPKGSTAASGHVRWSTPTFLPAGTYTYFCRVHPFMRGGFRVIQ
jgi:plastocyanin